MKQTKRMLAVLLTLLMLLSVFPLGMIQANAAYESNTKSYCYPIRQIVNTGRGFTSSHKGVDFTISKGTPVYASCEGTVEIVYTGCKNYNGANLQSGADCESKGCSSSNKVYMSKKDDNGNYIYRPGYYCNNGLGNGVVIKNTDGKYCHYGHMNSVSVKKGDHVTPNTKIGEVGSAGCSTGPHLHFSVSNKSSGGTYYNPFLYIFPGFKITLKNNGSSSVNPQVRVDFAWKDFEAQSCMINFGTSASDLSKKSTDSNVNAAYCYYELGSKFGNLTKGKTYYFKITIKKNDTTSASSVYSFVAGSGNKTLLDYSSVPAPVIAPTTSSISYNNNRVVVGNSINFTFNSDTATNYNLGVDAHDGTRVFTSGNQSSKSYTYACNTVGLYSAYVTARNDMGYKDSARVYFQVVSDTPTKVNTVEFNGHTYDLYLAAITWENAKVWCENNGGHLVTITSADEEATVEALLGNHKSGCWWFGGEETTGTYRWVTGEPWEYDNWPTDQSQPSRDVWNTGDKEQYLGTYHGTLWNDFANPSTSPCGFVMEKEPAHTTHIWDEGKITIKPTCTTDGVKTYTCTVCNATRTETIEATGHDYGAWTKLNDGQHQRVCANDSSHVEKANHTWDNGEITVPATFMGNGEKTYTCTVCNATRTEVVPLFDITTTQVTIPDDVTSIGADVFDNCTSLEKLTVGKIIGQLTVAEMGIPTGNLKTVIITDAATSVKASAFADCESLTNVTIGSGVRNIGDAAFSGCKSLTDLTIGNGVTSIGKNVFSHCDSLTSVTVPDSVTVIGNYAFSYCESLRSVTIGNGVKTIGARAFYLCNSLTNLTIPDSVTTIGKYAFEKCSGLTSLAIGNGVTDIADGAFSNCASLASATIPENVSSIGTAAFPRITVIYGVNNSAAQQYATTNGNTFRFICEKGSDHQWDDGRITTAATSNANGVKTYTCIVCYATKTEVIPKTESEALAAANVTRAPITFYYNGSRQRPVVTVTNAAGDTLQMGVDYTVSYPESVEPGSYLVRVDGIGNYTGTVRKTYTIKAVEALDASRVTRSPTVFYANDKQQQPTVNVTNEAGKTLKEGTDYKVTYPVSIEPGSYLVRVDGINGYTGTVRKVYTIKERVALDASRVTRTPTVFYANSKQQQPTVTVTNEAGKTLKEGTDYKVTYPESVEPGSYMVRVDGINGYKGTIRKAYTIKEREALAAANVTRTPTSFTANGTQQQPTVIVTNAAGKALTEGIDYKVVYPTSIEPGSYMVRVDGINGYKGTIRKTYTIK